jgi:hypothetical protein
MATSLVSTGITFPDATTQTTAAIGVLKNIQYFTASGTYTKATNNPSFVIVEVVGGGGGGHSASTTPSGVASGTTSSFGSFLSATGGAGATNGASLGGAGSGGNLNVSGTGGVYSTFGGGTQTINSQASSSVLGAIGSGGGGVAVSSNTVLARAASGGAGGYSVEKILASSLAASETVTVGTGGAASGSGTAGFNGIVIVYEYV